MFKLFKNPEDVEISTDNPSNLYFKVKKPGKKNTDIYVYILPDKQEIGIIHYSKITKSYGYIPTKEVYQIYSHEMQQLLANITKLAEANKVIC